MSDLLGVGDEDGPVPGVAPRLPALGQEGPGDAQGVRDSSVGLQTLPRLHWVESAQAYGHGGPGAGQTGQDQAGEQTSLGRHLVVRVVLSVLGLSLN